jgi:hypothetical protein
MIKSNYFKLSLREKDIYFIVSDIKKYHICTSHGLDLHDYKITIKDVHQNKTSEPFDEKYNGLLLCVDDKKNICIYDNVKKKYIDIEKTEDLHHVSYYYGPNIHYFSLENLIKEILLNISLSEN